MTKDYDMQGIAEGTHGTPAFLDDWWMDESIYMLMNLALARSSGFGSMKRHRRGPMWEYLEP